METIDTQRARPAAPVTGANGVGGAPPALTPAAAEAALAELGRELGQHATVDAVFGQPQVIGERTVIPVARLTYGFGGGLGGGPQARQRRAAPPTTSADGAAAEGFGFGGGGGVRAEPVAVVEIGPRGLRVVPVVDANRLIGRVFATVFGFALAALVVRAVALREPGAGRGAGRRRYRRAWQLRRGVVGLALLRRFLARLPRERGGG